MRHGFSFFVALFCLGGVAGCGHEDTAPAAASSPTEPQATPASVADSLLGASARHASNAARAQANASPAYNIEKAGSQERWLATNPVQRIKTRFERTGITIEPDSKGSWRLGIDLVSYGCANTTSHQVGDATPHVTRNKVTYHHQPPGGTPISEWYVHGPLGLEQGFTLPTAPTCAGDVIIEMESTGDLIPTLASDGRSIQFRSPRGVTGPSYRDLYVRDATGRELEANLRVKGKRFAIRVDVAGAKFPVRIDPIIALQQHVLVGDADSEFGAAVAIDGNTLFVGAPERGNYDTGLLAVYEWDGSAFIAESEFIGANYRNLGSCAAIDGNYAVVCGDNSYVYQRSAGVWQQGPKFYGDQADLSGGVIAAVTTAHLTFYEGSGSTWTDVSDFERAGTIYEYDRQAAVYGNHAFHVYQYTAAPVPWVAHYVRGASTWTLEDFHFAYGPNSVSMDGTWAMFGESSESSVHFYELSGGSWTLRSTIPNGSSLGTKVSVSGDVAVASDAATDLAYLYQRTGSTWSEVDEFGPSDTAASFGSSIAIDGNLIAVGAPNEDSVYIFRRGLDLGDACTTDEECAAGICADSVCCDARCDGLCEACTAALKGEGSDGACGPIVKDSDPDDECIDDGSPACTGNGMCDGNGSCDTYAGAGCTPSPCNGNNDCTSGHCVDGICCDEGCTGLCKACTTHLKGAGVNGVCDFIIDGRDQAHECATIGSGACEGDSVCNGVGACRSVLAGTVCVAGDCADTTQANNPDLCDATGTCVDMGTTQCGTYICSGGECLSSCSGNGDCQTGYECLGGSCGVGKNQGEACTTNTECSSQHCVEGVCCNEACTESCRSCLEQNKVAGSDGTCGYVKPGTDPKDGCAASATECLADGYCDGQGSCRAYAPASTECSGGLQCLSSTSQVVMECNGTGSCVEGTTTSCAPYTCSSTTQQCVTSCTTTADCAPLYYCDASSCVQSLDNGAQCTQSEQCKTGFCVEGVCCDQACTGDCQSCLSEHKGSGSNGTCGPIAAGSDPKNRCDASTTNECEADGFCDGSGACRAYAPSTKACQSGTVCSSQSTATGKMCDGAGSCVDTTSQACTPYICSSGSCLQMCTSSDDCLPTFYCSNSVCVGTKDEGSICSANEQCASGHCVEGVCCNTACVDGCTSCRNTLTGGTEGECLPVYAGTDPKNSCDASTTNECAGDGFCDGQGACRAYAPETKECEEGALCEGTTVAKGKMCDGAGNCVLSAGTACTPFICSQSTGSCLTTCGSHEECAPEYYCTNAICVPQLSNGVACSNSEQCLSGFCVEGVCCDQACSERCKSCIGNKTGGNNGVCENVLEGTVDPKMFCEASSNPCGPDGTCTAAGTCTMTQPADTQCGAFTCDGDVLVRHICDGFGLCITDDTSCAPFACSDVMDTCGTGCTNSDECAEGFYCDNSTCLEAKVDGESCAEAAECISGFCVEGVCCDSACADVCMSCAGTNTVAGTSGTCSAVVADRDPKDGCEASSDPCGADGFCDGEGACRQYAKEGTSCGEESCDGASVLAPQCDGSGVCETVSAKNCSPYVCDSATADCKTRCSSNDDCESGAQCDPQTEQCSTSSSSCKDAFTVEAPDGTETSCRPYKCVAGGCRESCDTGNDCANGYECKNGKCFEVSEGADAGTEQESTATLESEKGCGCRAAGHKGSTTGSVALLLMLAGGLIRRRR